MDETSLELLRKHGFGWVTPERQVTICDLHGHVSALRGHMNALPVDFDAWIAAVESLDARSAQDYQEFDENNKEGSGCGWHRFHSEASDKNDKLRNALMVWLYRTGWLRLGTASKYLEAEGCPSVLKRNAVFLEEIAVGLGKELRATPTTYAPYGGWISLSLKEMRTGLPDFCEKAVESLMRTKAWKGGMREKHMRFGVSWHVGLDAFRPEMLPVRLPSLLRLIPKADAPQWSGIQEVEDSIGKPWRWQGPLPASLMEAVRTHYFAEPPDREALRSILREAGADDIGPAPGALPSR